MGKVIAITLYEVSVSRSTHSF